MARGRRGKHGARGTGKRPNARITISPALRKKTRPKRGERLELVSRPKTERPTEGPTPGLVTVFDRIYNLARERKILGLKRISRELGLGKHRIELLAGILSRYGLVELEYPPIGDIRLRLREERESERPPERKGELLERYIVKTEDVPIPVEIRRVEGKPVPLYITMPPIPGPGTGAFMNYMLDTLVRQTKVAVEETIDPKKIMHVRERFHESALRELRRILGENGQNRVIACLLIHRMHGLGSLEPVLADDFLEELVINNSNIPVVVYHKKHGWLTTNIRIKTEDDIYNLASEIGRKVQREITTLNPLMDAHLLTGDRVAASLFPISTLGNTITIRKFSRTPWTIPALSAPEYRTLSVEVAAFLWQAMQYELNILVAGGTASGKTSMLNALCAMIPPTQRIISIEDTREIFLPSYLHWNWVPLTTRNRNPEGHGEVNMLDLMVSSLRMRPDRMIVGEVRRKKQAETMFEAMHTGHSVYTTMHADTGEQVRRRLLEPPIEIPRSELEALQLVLIQYRDRRRNLRRTLELVEILTGTSEEVQFNYLYRWHPRIDKFEKINDSVRVVEDLNLHTGMTLNEISRDLREKGEILKWMVKQKIFDIEDVGLVMKHYYKDPSSVITAANRNRGLRDIAPGK
jgi:flagellar protein FlaI